MRRIYIFLLPVLFLSCTSLPKMNTEPVLPDKYIRVSFYNFSTEDIYLFMAESGKSETAIGTINRDDGGKLKRVSSLIPSRKNVTFIIPAGNYAIIPKKDEAGRQNAGFNLYEEFYFPPSKVEYVIHLNPRHERITTASINLQENNKNILFPSFDILFRDEMIRPLVEENIELIDEDNKSVSLDTEWHNNRWLTARPQKPLLSSARYMVRVGLDARNTETDRIMETVELFYATGNVIDSISPFDPASVKYDISIPGYICLDWNLPFGSHGSEIHINDKNPEDLQGKTNYTIPKENNIILYKILPYRLNANGRKEYNKIDMERQLNPVPQLVMDGISFTHTIISNTVDRLEFHIKLHKNGMELTGLTPFYNFILRNNIANNDLAVLDNNNKFIYTANNPIYIPDEEVTYSLIEEDVILYSFKIKSPSAADTQAAADRKERAIAEEAAKQKSDNFWFGGNGEKFWSIGANVGTSFATPLFIGNLNITVPVFPYTFLEAGADIGLIHGKAGDLEIKEVKYHSWYYYGRFNLFIPWHPESGGFYFGAGGGFMDSHYVFTTAEGSSQIPTFDAVFGILIGVKRHYFKTGYSLRTNFSNVNNCVFLGYSFRIY